MRLLGLPLLILMLAGPATAGDNPDFRLPLHATVVLGGPCASTSVDCSGNRPVVNVQPFQEIEVCLLVYNAQSIIGLETAFEWDPSWTFYEPDNWGCRPDQLVAHFPRLSGGPDFGYYLSFFPPCILGPQVEVIARLRFTTGPAGTCLRQVKPISGSGINAIDCSQNLDRVRSDAYLGRICVTSGGHDACGSVATATEPTTWGKIKASY